MYDKDFYTNAGKRLKEAERRIEEARKHKSEKLDFSFLRLEKLPKKLWQLKYLKTLDLSGNLLRELPQEIEKLQNLETIYLWKNCFSEFPKPLITLKKLKELSLAENHLVFLPEEIKQMQSIEHLYLNHNTLLELPFEISELVNLKNIALNNNRLEVPPQQLVDWSNVALIRNFFLNPESFFPLDYYYAKIRAFLVKFRSLNSKKDIPSKELFEVISLINDAIDDIFPKIQKLIETLIKNLNSNITFERMDVRLCCLLSLNRSYLTSREIAIILLGFDNEMLISDENEVSKITFRINTRKSRLKKEKLEILLNEKDLDLDDFCRNIENRIKEKIKNE